MMFGFLCCKKHFNVYLLYKNKMSMHSVFKLYNHSPHITTKDVRLALSKTAKMKSYERLKYFHDRGMHFSRCVNYLNTIEKLDMLFDNNSVMEIDKDSTIIVSKPQNEKLSIQEIGKFIEELLKDTETN
jgi:hypothetical protein